MNIVTLIEEVVNGLIAAEDIFFKIQRISILWKIVLKHTDSVRCKRNIQENRER